VEGLAGGSTRFQFSGKRQICLPCLEQTYKYLLEPNPQFSVERKFSGKAFQPALFILQRLESLRAAFSLREH